MSQDVRQTELHERTQALLQGPLKHARAAALAAALLPLASVAPAEAQGAICPSAGTVCGFVWEDTNGNGLQDEDESGIEGIKVTLDDGSAEEPLVTETGPDGFYFFTPDFFVGNTFTISVALGEKWEPSPTEVGPDRTIDSNGKLEDGADSAKVTISPGDADTDFGLIANEVRQPGTGTPGFWKNHPEAWPVQSIMVGGLPYTKQQAIYWLGKVGKDKTTTMFSSLVPAMLNVMIGNKSSCVASTIADANAWMATHGPVGSNVSASSQAWADGQPLHQLLDSYNNGLLCAPHRD